MQRGFSIIITIPPLPPHTRTPFFLRVEKKHVLRNPVSHALCQDTWFQLDIFLCFLVLACLGPPAFIPPSLPPTLTVELSPPLPYFLACALILSIPLNQNVSFGESTSSLHCFHVLTRTLSPDSLWPRVTFHAAERKLWGCGTLLFSGRGVNPWNEVISFLAFLNSWMQLCLQGEVNMM